MAGPGMPYVLAENPLFSALEDQSTGAERKAALKRLLQKNPLWKAPAPTNSASPPNKHVEFGQWHLFAHWFGFSDQSDFNKGIVPKDMPAGSTGWWRNWHGHSHEIVRETFQRGYQLTLGLSGAKISLADVHALPKDPPCAPLRILWVCGLPSFQGFVFSHGPAPKSGTVPEAVTIILATPAVKNSYVDPRGAEFRAEPYRLYKNVKDGSSFDFDGTKRAWVIGHSISPTQKQHAIEGFVKKQKELGRPIRKNKFGEALVPDEIFEYVLADGDSNVATQPVSGDEDA